MRLASLPMYDWPESRDETLAEWARIRSAWADLPDLTAPDWSDIDGYWRNPDLVFSQCCWGPLSLGLIDWLSIAEVNELFLNTQPAHLQKLRKTHLESGERNIARAAYLREHLSRSSLENN